MPLRKDYQLIGTLMAGRICRDMAEERRKTNLQPVRPLSVVPEPEGVEETFPPARPFPFGDAA